MNKTSSDVSSDTNLQVESRLAVTSHRLSAEKVRSVTSASWPGNFRTTDLLAEKKYNYINKTHGSSWLMRENTLLSNGLCCLRKKEKIGSPHTPYHLDVWTSNQLIPVGWLIFHLIDWCQKDRKPSMLMRINAVHQSTNSVHQCGGSRQFVANPVPVSLSWSRSDPTFQHIM